MKCFKFFAVVLSVVLFAATTCSCTSSKKPVEPNNSAPISQKVTGSIGIYSSFSTLPVLKYPEYLSSMNEGYVCEIKKYQTFGEPLEALTAGEVDICIASLPAVLQAQLDGHSVKIVGNFFQKGSAVVASADTEIRKLQDLEGKKVGYTQGTMEYALLRANLYNLGIEENSITWKEIPPEQFNASLKAGNIDAYCGDAALAGAAQADGIGRIVSYPYLDDLGYGNQVLVTTDSAIQEKREWIQEILDTHYQVVDLVVPCQDCWLPDAEAIGLNTESIAIEKDNYQWLWDMEEEYVMYTRNLCNYLCKMQIFEEMPDMNTLFDFSFLDTVNRKYMQ